MAPSIIADPSAAGAAFLGAPALGNNNLGNNNLAAMQRRKGAAKRAAAATGGAAGPMEPEPEPDEEEEDTSTRGKARLTMMEEVLLLGLKDEGYTSFWNDSISYGLRGCILAELMLRGRIKCVKAKLPLEEKKLEVVDTSKTGEIAQSVHVSAEGAAPGCRRRPTIRPPTHGTQPGPPPHCAGDRILDEVLEVMATSASRAHSCGYWVDVLSGESWNVMKLKFSIKNLRERLAKGLVDKGVLGTESQSFGLFEMATHPLKDASVKEEVVFRVQVSTSTSCQRNTRADFQRSTRPRRTH